MVADADAEAREIYRLAGADLYDPPGGAALARMILGEDQVRYVSNLERPAKYSPEDRCIYLRRKTIPSDANFLCCHELTEWYCDFCGYHAPNREFFCNRVASRLVAPTEALRASFRMIQRLPEPVANWFCTTQSVAGLRIGEVTGRPLVLVTPEWVTARGEPFVWPERPILDRLARGTLRVPEIERIPLTDTRRRVILAAVG